MTSKKPPFGEAFLLPFQISEDASLIHAMKLLHGHYAYTDVDAQVHRYTANRFVYLLLAVG